MRTLPSTHVPLEVYSSSGYDGHDLGALASERLPWDYKHKDFKASAAWLLRQYHSKVVAVSDDSLTPLSLLRAWYERMPEDKHAAGLWNRLKGKTLEEIKETKAETHAPPTGEASTANLVTWRLWRLHMAAPSSVAPAPRSLERTQRRAWWM